MVWPDYFPECCPPDDARLAEGRVFRLAWSPKLDINDFLSWRQENPSKPVRDECKACGVSVLGDLADAEALRRRIPGQRSKVIVVGDLVPGFGRIRPTPSHKADSHQSWWVPEGVDPSPRFTAIEEGGEA